MRLKNILIVVSDIEKSKNFYHDLFGLQVLRDFGDNVILSEGLVLQEQKNWEMLIGSNTVTGNASELFFEENDLDAFLMRLNEYDDKNVFMINQRVNSWGKRVVMAKDYDGHIIEIAES